MTPRHHPGIAAAIVLALPGLLLTAAPAGARQVAPVAATEAPTQRSSMAQDPAAPTPRPSVVTMPSWVRRPAPQFPERAQNQGVGEGRVTLHCPVAPDGMLTDCQIVEEVPLGVGFGQAALVGVREAQLQIPDGGGAGPRSTTFTLRFRLSDPPLLAVIENPVWSRSPRAAFPRAAARAGVTEARVRLDCEVNPFSDRLRNCMVTQEDPAGLGFGEAALKAAREAVIFAQIRNEAVPGAHVVFTVPFSR